MLDSLDTLIAFTLIMLVVSLLITITVQMISSFLNLRGFNLAKGLSKTFETVYPHSEKQAKEFTNHVLKGAMISDSSFWRRATAVRPDELFDAIHRIALGKQYQDASDHFKDYAKNLLLALHVNKQYLDEGASAIESAGEVTKAAESAISALPEGTSRENLERSFSKVSNQLQAYATAEADRIKQQAIDTALTLDQAYEKFKFWCDVCQERVQQWFTMHTRFFTVILAVVFAFFLQLDTVEIFKFISTNHTARDKLITQATLVSSHAEKILSESKNVLGEALSALTDNQGDNLDVKNALKSIKAEDSDSRESLRKRLVLTLESNPSKERLLGDFDSAVDKAASNCLNAKACDFRAVKEDLDHTGFDLFPMDGNWRWGKEWTDGIWQHLLGILFSAGLLSLGAPFWYNILKSLTNLRSTVARNISDEQKEAKKQSNFRAGRPPTT